MEMPSFIGSRLNLDKLRPKLDFDKIVNEFKQMPTQEPVYWGQAPRVAVLVGIAIVICVLAYFLVWSGELESLDNARADTLKLKEEYKSKKTRSLQIDVLKEHLQEAERNLQTLLRQLPTRTEMEALLVDINQVGVGRGLGFNLFKPGKEVSGDLYIELPVEVKLTGSYHDFGGFVADVARLPRIVTVNNIVIQRPKKGRRVSQRGSEMQLDFHFIIKTFRSPDENEQAAMAAKKRAERKKRK